MTLERVNTLIDRVMAEHPHTTPKALAVYYEAVHQELAPLARSLELENDELRVQLQAQWREAALARKAAVTHVWTCACGNVYRGGEKNVTIFADWGRVMCRVCSPTCERTAPVMVETTEPRQ